MDQLLYSNWCRQETVESNLYIHDALNWNPLNKYFFFQPLGGGSGKKFRVFDAEKFSSFLFCRLSLLSSSPPLLFSLYAKAHKMIRLHKALFFPYDFHLSHINTHHPLPPLIAVSIFFSYFSSSSSSTTLKSQRWGKILLLF